MTASWSSRVALGSLLLIHAAALGAQTTGRITGSVVDRRTQRPVQAATVLVENVGMGTVSDDAGRFALANVPAGDYTVRVRRIGFVSAAQTVRIQAGQTVNLAFELSETAVRLEEVVSTGTAVEVRAKQVPTSTAIVGSEQFRNAPVVNTQDVLTGRIPSVTVTANSGQPGAGGTVRIRGTNTITQSTAPLIYVDGIRIYNESIRANWGSRTGINPLQDINAEDIERVEVVKGAAATTLYGTEASGGVIQIFTKKGSSGAPQWSAEITQGVNTSVHWGDDDDPTNLFVDCRNTTLMYGIASSRTTVGTRTYQIGERVPFADPTCPSDGTWTQAGHLQNYSLSIRGGSERVTYYASGNFGDNRGVLPNQQNKEGGFRGNFGFYPFNELQFQLSTHYTRRNTSFAGDGNNAEGFLLNVGRGWRNYMQGGKGDDCAGVADTIVCITNAYVFDQTLTARNDHFITGLSTIWTPTPALTNRFAVGWDYTDINGVTNLPFGFLTLEEGYFWDENTRHTKLSLDYSGSLRNNVFGVASTFSWGGQIFRDRHRWTELDVQGFGGPGEPTLESGAELTYRADRPLAETNAGFFFQEEIGWRERLFITAGLRVDGNSAFGENFGLQTYPKVGASYVLSDYDFWPKGWWDTFKIRGAIGEAGKAPGAFDKVRTYAPVSGGDPVTGDEAEPGFSPANIGNPDVGPERTRETEVGFDAGFLNGRVGLELTVFRAKTTDALVPVVYPASQGFLSSRIENVGALENKGLELSLTGTVLRTSFLEWRARAHATYLRSKAIDMDRGRDNVDNEVYTGLNSWVREGQPFPVYMGRRVTNPDAIADPIIEDDAILGNVNPNRLLSLGSTVNVGKNLTLDALIEHQGGFVVQNYTAYQNARRGVWYPCYDVQEKTIASYGPDRRRNTADDVPGMLAGITAMQRAQCGFTGHSIAYWTEKGDFTRLRHVSVSYQLPPRLISGRSGTVTLSGRNLYNWTEYSGSDSEMQDFADQANLVGTNGRFGRRDYYQIPAPRTWTVSLRVNY